jgi:hypothetical protein
VNFNKVVVSKIGELGCGVWFGIFGNSLGLEEPYFLREGFAIFVLLFHVENDLLAVGFKIFIRKSIIFCKPILIICTFLYYYFCSPP